MKMSKMMLVSIFILIALSGCTVAKVNAKGSVPLVLNQTDQKVTVIKSFKQKERSIFDYTNSFEMTSITNKIVNETNADAVVNVEFKLKFSFTDYLLNVITFGFARSKTIEVTGDAVKYIN